MLRDLTDRVFRLWSSRDLGAGLRIFSQRWFVGFHNPKAFRVSDWSLLQSQDSLHHMIACIFYLSVSIYIQMANLAADGTGA